MAYKAPFNYIGNKYRIIDQLESLFPSDINTFVDLFCGGGDVTINTPAKHKVANDVNFFVVGILKWIKSHTTKEVLTYIHGRIAEFHLSKDNKNGYLALRDAYNAQPLKARHPMDLYVLMCFSFNYQIRFNSHLEYNNPFGKDRSCFTGRMRANLVAFHDLIENTDLMSEDFRQVSIDGLGENDFVYADPPYSLTCGSYNDGKRGFNGWTSYDDFVLMQKLDLLNARGVMFALSNVLEHKGKRNLIMQRWIERNDYNVHDIGLNYNNSSYHTRNRLFNTREVLITNY